MPAPPGTGDSYVLQDSISDLSGQGNIECADIRGSDGSPMSPASVTYLPDGNWSYTGSEVSDTPDVVLQFPQGNGSRCLSTYYRHNARAGMADIGGNVDIEDSFACTDGLKNVEEEVVLPAPSIYTTTDDACTVTVNASGQDISGEFDVFTAQNLDGSVQAICNAAGKTQNQCVRACPEFKNIDELQDAGYCQAGPNGKIPLWDDLLAADDPNGDGRCTPCLTAAEAEAQITGFDAEGLKLCWEWTNSVNTADGTYRPHKPIRTHTTETTFFNECYETTTTVLWFGMEIPYTYTTCY